SWKKLLNISAKMMVWPQCKKYGARSKVVRNRLKGRAQCGSTTGSTPMCIHSDASNAKKVSMDGCCYGNTRSRNMALLGSGSASNADKCSRIEEKPESICWSMPG